MTLTAEECVQQMAEMFQELAEEIAEEKRQNAESRAEELYNKTIKNVNEKLEKEFAREQSEIQKELLIREAQIKNNVKLEILKSQTEAIHEALKEAIRELNKFSEGPDYPELLKKLIAEGLNTLKESRVRLMIRKSDQKIAENILPGAIEIAKKLNPTIDFNVKIDDKRFLPSAPACAGGVILICQKGKVRVSNVLNDRLRLVYERALPKIRAMVVEK
ncbi:putative vacuolar ATP synthase subunit E [Histomonas meleagridis]|uniref:putative vacuolar ATP synthase subunit E n=1 Tax=Histomonas meleagridis TaxID=135588 RepID=UPI003559D611|nr:putative vacuolar ATP synthase subunit E [Histomonas meleagridis]KAH0804541.1 putative vacuolar ATP synthase subunit E [Histomonas meleagridis]